MKINATFQGKQLAMEEEPCEVRKVISLPDKEYAFFKKHLMLNMISSARTKTRWDFTTASGSVFWLWENPPRMVCWWIAAVKYGLSYTECRFPKLDGSNGKRK